MLTNLKLLAVGVMCLWVVPAGAIEPYMHQRRFLLSFGSEGALKNLRSQRAHQLIQALEGRGLIKIKHDLEFISAVVVRIPQEKLEQVMPILHDMKLNGDLDRMTEDLPVYVLSRTGSYWDGSVGASGSPAESPKDLNAFEEEPALPVLGRPAEAPILGDGASEEIPWGVARMNAPQAWERSQGVGVRVAVLDTGLDRHHPDLAANIDGGWNAVDNDQDFADRYDDLDGHGTQVAGIIAAAENGIGVVGVAPGARLYGVKVVRDDGTGYVGDILAGIQWAVRHHVQVINLSFGHVPNTELLHRAIQVAVNAGIPTVCGAGNGGRSGVTYPAAYPECIAVSASNEDDTFSSEWYRASSSFGPEVDFIAPGAQVRTTMATISGDWLVFPSPYDTFSGTSFAAPHITGLIALKLSQTPDLTVGEVRRALREASFPLPGLDRYRQGHGLPDAVRLLGAGRQGGGN